MYASSLSIFEIFEENLDFGFASMVVQAVVKCRL